MPRFRIVAAAAAPLTILRSLRRRRLGRVDDRVDDGEHGGDEEDDVATTAIAATFLISDGSMRTQWSRSGRT